MRKLLLLVMIMFCFNVFSATYYVTSAGSGSKDGSTWANAMDTAAFITAANSASHRFYLMGGETYTLTTGLILPDYRPNIIGVASGTTAEPPAFLGADIALGDDRPLIACGEYTVEFKSWSYNFNVRYTGTGTFVVKGGTYSVIKNCSVINTSETADRQGITSFPTITLCSAKSTNGLAINGSSKLCYVYDSKNGISGGTAFNNIANSCSNYGISVQNYGGAQAINNTVYNCPIGIQNGNYGTDAVYANNLIVGCSTYGISNINHQTDVLFGNNFYNITGTRIRYATSELTYSEIDPDFVDAANGDFTPQNTALVGQAYPTTFIGTDTDNKSIAGAVQLDGSVGNDQSHFSVY